MRLHALSVKPSGYRRSIRGMQTRAETCQHQTYDPCVVQPMPKTQHGSPMPPTSQAKPPRGRMALKLCCCCMTRASSFQLRIEGGGRGGEDERPQRRLHEGNDEEASLPSWSNEQPRVSLGHRNSPPSYPLSTRSRGRGVVIATGGHGLQIRR
jgi:hypothetical protein